MISPGGAALADAGSAAAGAGAGVGAAGDAGAADCANTVRAQSKERSATHPREAFMPRCYTIGGPQAPAHGMVREKKPFGRARVPV